MTKKQQRSQWSNKIEVVYIRGRPGHLHGGRRSARGTRQGTPDLCYRTLELLGPHHADRVLRVATGPRITGSTLSYTIPRVLTFLFRSPGFPQFHKSVTMDIDDILREVDPVIDTIPSETRDLQALTRAWVAERCAPELLECATPFNAQTTLCRPSRIRSNAFYRLDGPPTAFLSA